MRNIIPIITLIAIGITVVVGGYLAIKAVPGKPLNLNPILLWTIVSWIIIGSISGIGVYSVEKRSQKVKPIPSTPKPVESIQSTDEQIIQGQQQTTPHIPSPQPSPPSAYPFTSTAQGFEKEKFSQTHVAANFGKFLRSEINQQGLLPSRVAQQAGVSENQLMLWAGGDEIPSTQQYISLRDAFNLPHDRYKKWEEFMPAIHYFDPKSKRQ